jgi:signal transduction histidine kinase
MALRQRAGWVRLVLPIQDDDHEPPENDVIEALAIALPGDHHLRIGRNLDERGELYEHTLRVLVVIMALSLFLALTGGPIMSWARLSHLEIINRVGRPIMTGDLMQRVPVTGRGNEFDQLAVNLNAMLDQIECLMEGMRQMTGNVAHDLRRSLNRLHTRFEVILLTLRSNKDYLIAIEQMLTGVADLLGTFNALLSIAQIESGADCSDFREIALSTLTHNVAELYTPVIEDK